MKTSSAKAKGRRLQNWVGQKVAKLTGFACGADEPIEPRRMGQNGVDIRLESQVRRVFPYSIECKNTEKWSVNKAIEQVKADQYPNTDWLVVLAKNRTKPVVVLDAEVFFELLDRVLNPMRRRKRK